MREPRFVPAGKIPGATLARVAPGICPLAQSVARAWHILIVDL